jgi:hypothetical protein
MADAAVNIAPAHTEILPRVNGASLRNGARAARPLEEKQQQELRSAVHQELIRRLVLEKLGEAQDTRTGQQQLLTLIQQVITEQNIPLSSGERDRVANEVMDELFGLGPLEPLLKDDSISDILVNTWSHVYVERLSWRLASSCFAARRLPEMRLRPHPGTSVLTCKGGCNDGIDHGRCRCCRRSGYARPQSAYPPFQLRPAASATEMNHLTI